MTTPELINKLMILSVTDDVHTMTAEDRQVLQEAAGRLNSLRASEKKEEENI